MEISIENKVDVRVKIIFAFCLSTLSVFLSGYRYMSILLIISVFISKLFRGDIFFVIYKIRKVLWIFITMIFIQSFFIKSGAPVVIVRGICIITDIGLLRAFEFIFRLSIIMVSTTIIMTSNSREVIQGLIQLKLPFELAFTVLGDKV